MTRSPHRMSSSRRRVHDSRARLRAAPVSSADDLAQPVMQFDHQPRIPPAGEEGVDPAARASSGGHRPPLDAVVDEVAHRVDHLPAAVALRACRPGPRATPAPAADPARGPTRHRSCPSRTGAGASAGRPHSRTDAGDSHTQEWTDWTRQPRPRDTSAAGPLASR